MNCRKGPRGAPLPPRLLAKLQATIEELGSVEATSRHLNIPVGTVFRARNGERLYPESHEAFAEALGRGAAGSAAA